MSAILAIGTFAILAGGSGVTKENFDRIHEGMTKTDVDKLLGANGELAFPVPNVRGNAYSWQGAVRINVLVDGDGIVMDKKLIQDGPESLGDKLLRLIRWPWR